MHGVAQSGSAGIASKEKQPVVVTCFSFACCTVVVHMIFLMSFQELLREYSVAMIHALLSYKERQRCSHLQDVL